METGLGRPVKPGRVFLAVWKKFYRGYQGKIMDFGPSGRPRPGRAWIFRSGPADFGPVSTLTQRYIFGQGYGNGGLDKSVRMEIGIETARTQAGPDL